MSVKAFKKFTRLKVRFLPQLVVFLILLTLAYYSFVFLPESQSEQIQKIQQENLRLIESQNRQADQMESEIASLKEELNKPTSTPMPIPTRQPSEANLSNTSQDKKTITKEDFFKLLLLGSMLRDNRAPVDNNIHCSSNNIGDTTYTNCY